MCHHHRTEHTRLYEDSEHENLPEWALEEEEETESDEEQEPFAPGAAD
jgi:replication initiation and membrane attachment protein DnaB